MEQKLADFFARLNLTFGPEETKALEGASIVKAEIKKGKEKTLLVLKTQNILPVSLLAKIEKTFKNNEFNLIFKLEIQPVKATVTNQLMRDYWDYISQVKASDITQPFKNFDSKKLHFEADGFKVICRVQSLTQKKEMEADIRYYQRKFFQYGFSTLVCEIIYEAIDFDTIENEQTQKYRALMQEAQNKQQQAQQQRTNSPRRMANGRGNGKYNNSLDTPTYQKLIDVEDNAQNIVIHAMVMNKEIKISKTGRKIYLLNITDNTSSFKATYFSRNEESTIFDDLTEDELNSDVANELKTQKAQIGD